MKLSEITFIQWMGGILVVNGAVLGYSNEVADLFGPIWQKHIFSVMTIGSAIVGGFITIFGGIGTQARNVVAAGGQVNVSPLAATALTTLAQDVGEPAIKSTGTIIKVLIAAFLLSALISGLSPAMAQSRPKLTGNIAADFANATQKPGVALTGNVQADLQALWQKIVTSSLADLNYAAAMAASANTTTSAIRLQCVKAIIQLNEQASGANLKNADGTPMVKPDPHLFTDVESMAEIIDNLSPQGPLFVSCAGAAQLAKTNVLTFVNGVVTGVAGFAAMPVIPGL